MARTNHTAKTTIVILVVLIIPALLTAQDTNPLPSTLSPGQALANVQSVPAHDSGTNNQKPIESVLCNPPSKTTTHVRIEIVNAEENADLRQYLDVSVLPLIRANWYRLLLKSGEKVGGQATIQFTVLKDGAIASPKLTDGAGHAALGDLALKALSSSTPFPALPSDFAGPSIDLRTDFSYEPPANASTKAASSYSVPLISTHVCSADETAKGGAECVTPPKAVYAPEPAFTEEARRKKMQGTVTLFATVAKDGTVKSVCASHPLDGGLDAIAVETVRTWKFEPAIFDGKPCDVPIAVKVDFHLSDDPAAAPLVKYEPMMGSPAPGGTNDHPPNINIRVLAHATDNVVGDAVSSKPSAPQCDGQTGGCTKPPRIILSPALQPTSEDARARNSGTATLSLTVSVEGKPENIKVVKSLGRALDQKAIAAIEKWRFEPAMKNGKPVPLEILVDVDFHLY